MMKYIKTFCIIGLIFNCCTDSNEKELNYFRLVKFDNIDFLDAQGIELEISIGPDSSNVYLTEYKYAQKNDSTFELIPYMTRNLKSKELVLHIDHLLKDIDTTYDFTAIGAYGISTKNKRYYVKKSTKLDSICKKLILEIKGNNSQSVDYYEYHRKYEIPLPPLQGRISN